LASPDVALQAVALRARAHWRWLGAYLLLASGYAFGCSASSRDGAVVASDAESIVYGTDDRTEPYEDETSPSSLADAASNSTAVIVLQSDVQTSDDGSVRLESGTLQDAYGVCATERYADQPSAGFCTAMLVEPDVVMTAGHCLALMSCPRLALVFGFQYDSPGVLHRLTSSDVYGCAEVLLSKVSDPSDSQVLDYAFIRLDRPVAPPLQPLGLDHSGAALAEGSAVSLIGHGGGLPTKIARNGVVTDGRPETRDYFSATVDNYSGGSGSGVFDSENNLVGIAVRGEGRVTTGARFQSAMIPGKASRSPTSRARTRLFARRAIPSEIGATARRTRQPVAPSRSAWARQAEELRRGGSCWD
jgi:V8-like Glu-specific endopeptidase